RHGAEGRGHRSEPALFAPQQEREHSVDALAIPATGDLSEPAEELLSVVELPGHHGPEVADQVQPVTPQRLFDPFGDAFDTDHELVVGAELSQMEGRPDPEEQTPPP